MIEAGLAYPTYYEGLYPEFREALTRACREARNGQRGFWPLDRTNSGIVVEGRPGHVGKYIIFPKLFRRLVGFLRENRGLSDFKEYLEANPDPVTHLLTGRRANLAALVHVQDTSVKLAPAPEELVFVEN